MVIRTLFQDNFEDYTRYAKEKNCPCRCSISFSHPPEVNIISTERKLNLEILIFLIHIPCNQSLNLVYAKLLHKFLYSKTSIHIKYIEITINFQEQVMHQMSLLLGNLLFIKYKNINYLKSHLCESAGVQKTSSVYDLAPFLPRWPKAAV